MKNVILSPRLLNPKLLVIAVLILSSCKKDEKETPSVSPKLTSSMFTDNAQMPKETGRYFGNASPDLRIENVPSGTVEMVLTMRDKSNNDSWHWAVWDIPNSKTTIAKKESWSGTGAVVGQNDYGSGYVGPFPPSEHEYVFTVYFLNQNISLSSAQYNLLPSTMQGKIISQVTLTGRYKP